MEPLKKILPVPVNEVLRMISESAPAAARISFHLRSGSTFTGQLLTSKVTSSGNVTCFTVLLDNSKSDVLFLESRDIEAVTIHDSLYLIDDLTAGQVETVSQDVPSVLDLKRLIKKIKDQTSHILEKDICLDFEWSTLPGTQDPVVWSLKVQLDILGTVISKYSGDTLFMKSFRDQVDSILLAHGEEPSVDIRDKVLMIHVDLLNASSGRHSTESLQDRIEEIL